MARETTGKVLARRLSESNMSLAPLGYRVILASRGVPDRMPQSPEAQWLARRRGDCA
jgi:hypothetical protein